VNSNLTTETLPAASGIVDSFTFDAADRLMGISDVKGGILTLFSATYGRDNANQLTADSSAPATTAAYRYTTLNQLCYSGAANTTSCSTPPAGATAYAYDAADNLTQMGTTQQAFNAADELCWTAALTGPCGSPPTGATTYTYDARGNRTQIAPLSGGATTLSYDQANRLTADGSAGTYAYNGDGLRMSKTVNGTTSQFLWDVTSTVPILLKDASTAYVYGPGGLPLEQINGSSPFWLHHDQLASIRLVTDSTGASQATYSFDAYGNLTTSTGTITNPFRFAGQYRDAESSLYYLRARYYDPSTGQFVSQDPAVATTRGPYGYVRGNPLNAVDPTGLLCWAFWDPNQCDNPWTEYSTNGSSSLGMSASADAGAPNTIFQAGGSLSADTWVHVKDPMTPHKTGTIGGFAGRTNGWAVGIQCSAGVHASMSNASNMGQIYGKFHNVNINAGAILLDVSLTYSWSDKGIWVFTPQVGSGLGLSASSYDTNTGPNQ
jgi:RHS repeat-associated protein